MPEDYRKYLSTSDKEKRSRQQELEERKSRIARRKRIRAKRAAKEKKAKQASLKERKKMLAETRAMLGRAKKKRKKKKRSVPPKVTNMPLKDDERREAILREYLKARQRGKKMKKKKSGT